MVKLLLIAMCVLAISGCSKIKNAVGSYKGYGSCNSCGDSWSWKEGHSITYEFSEEITVLSGVTMRASRGMFPVCEECYNSLNVDEIMINVAETLVWWNELSPGHRSREEMRKIYDGCKVTVIREKGGLNEGIFRCII